MITISCKYWYMRCCCDSDAKIDVRHNHDESSVSIVDTNNVVVMATRALSSVSVLLFDARRLRSHWRQLLRLHHRLQQVRVVQHGLSVTTIQGRQVCQSSSNQINERPPSERLKTQRYYCMLMAGSCWSFIPGMRAAARPRGAGARRTWHW
jgi:hypothetical protein